MFGKFLVLLTTLLCACQAIGVGKGLVIIDDQTYGLFQKEIPLNLTDTKLSIGFTLLSDKKDPESYVQPKQVSIVLKSENLTSSLYYYPKLVENKVYEANILIKDISKFMLSQDAIDIEIITGDNNDTTFNSIIKGGKLLPSEKLKVDKSVEKPVRFGKLNEIHHIFRQPPKSLPSFISTQFVFLIIILFIVLLLSWNYFEAANINNIGKFSPLSLLFIVTLFIFEYLFFDYYLGTSIFTSLYRFSLTGVFSIYFGSKLLKDMYKLRTKNIR